MLPPQKMFLIWNTFLQSSDSSDAACPQNPLTARMGSNSGTDSKNRSTNPAFIFSTSEANISANYWNYFVRRCWRHVWRTVAEGFIMKWENTDFWTSWLKLSLQRWAGFYWVWKLGWMMNETYLIAFILTDIRGNDKWTIVHSFALKNKWYILISLEYDENVRKTLQHNYI